MGQLGDGVAVHAPCSVGSTCARSPVDVVGVTDAIEIAVGDEHACALRKSRAVVCWGNDWEGQLGSADAGTEGCQGGSSITYPCSRTPVAVAVPPVDTISAGAVTTCGLASGNVWCWGSNEFGENGSGTIGKAPEPVQVAGLVDAVEISVGYHHACARRSGGTVVCWGWAMDGEMGDGQPTHPSCTGAPCASTPVAVAGLADAVAIDGRFTHTCARRTNGTVVCWGDDRSGEIGDGPTSGSCAEIGACRDAPVAVSNVTDVAAIATGAHFGLFLTRTCELWSTGTNSGAQLGAGDTVSRDAPVRASSVTF